MSAMVDRVAAALHPVGWPRTDITDGDRQQMRDEARTAIAAMREPTPAMKSAGRRAYLDSAPAGTEAAVIWPAMIDEALR